jgi:hypothetical protein
MASKSKTRSTDRRARIAEQRRADQARDRRARILTWTAIGVIIAGLIGGGWYLVDSSKKKEKEGSSESAAVTGEKTWSKLTRNHVSKDVKYPMTPPVGGDHDPVWQNCDGVVYKKELRDENAVHALEHGAVWITYNDKAAAADVKTLGTKVSKTPYTFLSPYTSQSSPITLSAWEHQLNVKQASDPRVAKFLDTYVQGKQTPEPGASCSNGKSS